MRIQFRNMLATLLVASTPGLAQQVYHAPKGPDGHPNLNGIWQALNTANWDLLDHSARPGLVIADGTLSADRGGGRRRNSVSAGCSRNEEEEFRESLEAGSGDPLLSAGRAARELHAVSVSDFPKREGAVLRLSIRRGG